MCKQILILTSIYFLASGTFQDDLFLISLKSFVTVMLLSGSTCEAKHMTLWPNL